MGCAAPRRRGFLLRVTSVPYCRPPSPRRSPPGRWRGCRSCKACWRTSADCPSRTGVKMSTSDAKEHWEEHYGERNRVWSGRVNVRLTEVVSALEPGRALDLGCGEGADAWWLAERGWSVVAVDISETALRRATAEADARGLSDRIEFAQHDLSESSPDGTF